MKHLSLIYSFLCIFALNLEGQDPSLHFLTDALDEFQDEAMAEDIYEELLGMLEKPLNINTCTEDELQKLIFLNGFQVYSILKYRKESGFIYSLNELNLLPCIPPGTFEKIKPFFTVGDWQMDSPPSAKPIRGIKGSLIIRTQWKNPLPSGFTEQEDTAKTFLGNRQKQLLKYQIEAGERIRAGLTLEKDEGEKYIPFKKKANSGFFSGYMELKHPGMMKKVILGDYRIASASGLVFGYGMNGKSTGFILSNSLPSLSKYSSSAEYGFYRGGAIELQRKSVTAIFYGSEVKRSVNMQDNLAENTFFTSIKEDGLSRNHNEINEYRNLKEKAFGMLTAYNNGKLTFGYNLQYTIFEHDYSYRIRPDRYSTTGRESKFLVQSAFYEFRKGDLLIFGEMAGGINKAFSTLQGISFRLHSLITMSTSLRYFSPEYISFTSSAFGETGGTRNESGFYFALEAYPFRFLKSSFYSDIYQFPWLKYTACAPSFGNDMVLKNEIRIHRNWDLIVYIKRENSEGEIKTENREGAGLKKMEAKEDRRILFRSIWKPNDFFTFKTSLEQKMSKTESTSTLKSNFLSQDITASLFSDHLRFSARFALFDIPDWSVRIYAWENDLLYAFSSPAFYHKGSRYYFVARYSLSENLKLWFKYGASCYISDIVSGTGPDKREGNLFEEFKIQVQWKIP